MMWFTSDLHFGHKNVIQYENRPFHIAEEMDRALIDNWNDTVDDYDTVYVLGDFCMNKALVKKYGKQLKGFKRIVPGNHDSCFNLANKSPEKRESLLHSWDDAGFSLQPEQLELETGVHPLLLCHFPYREVTEGSGYEPRYLNKRPEFKGKWLIHGHVHGKWLVLPEYKCFNVSVEVHNYRPVSIDMILRVISEHESL